MGTWAIWRKTSFLRKAALFRKVPPFRKAFQDSAGSCPHFKKYHGRMAA
jgi:hypothetical protein